MAPGNGGTARDSSLENLALDPVKNPQSVAEFVKQNNIALTVVGPEAPLAAGIVDIFRAEKLAIFGPVAAAAQLESSKDFAKRFMKEHDIPTAEFETFSARATHGYPYQGSNLAVGKILNRFSSRDPEPQLLFPFPVRIGDWADAWKLDNFDYLSNL